MLLLEAVAQHEVKHGQASQLSQDWVVLQAVVLQGQTGELVQRGHLHVEVGGLQDGTLHLEELLRVVEAVAQVHVLLGLEGVDLVVF